ncbi:MAG TPA: DUF1156 domain-containing protein [Ktedonosporobacter sp.]|nr:DUF1156 domain-containing protein [Ktedonosporobacter sp.]
MAISIRFEDTEMKRLIEVDLPIKLISEQARREKSIRHGHISTLHIWWARRPLAACRAVLCAALWPDPADENCPPAFRVAVADILAQFAAKLPTDGTLAGLCKRHWKDWLLLTSQTLNPDDWQDSSAMRYHLLNFIADFANWDASNNPTFLATARELTQAAHESLGGLPGTRPLVVDPFAGGGAIPLEALRVGADAFASDLNPVAVLLNKVLLEYIPRYGQKLADEVRRWGIWIKEQAEQELAEFYPKDADGATPIAYLWARTITCEGPGCGAEVPLMRSFWLAKKGSKSVALRLIPNPVQKRVDFALVHNPKASEVGEGTIRRGSAECPVCGYTTPVASVRRQLKARRGGAADARLIAIRYDDLASNKRSWRLVTEEDLIAINKAIEYLERRLKNTINKELSLIPHEALPPQGTLGFRVQLYGLEKWSDLFTPRQMLTQTTLALLIQEVGKKLIIDYDPDLATAVQTCLALALNRFTDFNSSLCTLNVVGGRGVAHTFVRQALAMVWDFMETNPFNEVGANWQTCIDVIGEIVQTESQNDHEGTTHMASATQNPLPDDATSALFTDPPYYDAVPYADLSDFFYVWLKRTLPASNAALYATELTLKQDECIVDEIKGKDRSYFESTIGLAMAESCRILAPDGIGVVVFAHQSTASWEALLQAMNDSGWTITGSWPIDTERPGRLRAQDSAALASSIHLVCRPRKGREEVGDWRDVLQELPRRVREWMPRLAAEGIVGADAIFSCLGPALEVFSRYSSVERADGEPVTLKEYLEHVWAAVSREALHTIFQGADTSSFEPDARLTAMWLWTLSAANEKNGTGNEQADGKSATIKETSADYVAADVEAEAEDEEEEAGPKPGLNGYVLEFDTARKIAQGLGAHLDKVGTLVEIKGSSARLRPLQERARFLFQKGADDLSLAKPRKKAKIQQQSLFSLPELAEEIDIAGSMGEMPEFNLGTTVLDRVHQAMLLYASGRIDVLKHFLKEEGAGTDERFWKLALALSSLYPRKSDERRWIDGVQTEKKSLGL